MRLLEPVVCIRLHLTVSSYETAKEGEVISYPNISFIDEDGSIRYINKPSWITITYDVTDTSIGIYLFNVPVLATDVATPEVQDYAYNYVYRLVIDGTIIEGTALSTLRDNGFYYEFDPGLHTVEYYFISGDILLDTFKGDNNDFVVDIDFSNFRNNIGSAYWSFMLNSSLYVDASNIDFSDQFNGNGDVEGMFFDSGTVYINGNGITNTSFYSYLCPGCGVLVDVNYLVNTSTPKESSSSNVIPVFPKSRVYFSESLIEEVFGGNLPYSYRNGVPLIVKDMTNLSCTGENEWVPLRYTGVYDYLSNNLDLVNSIDGEFCRKNGEYIELYNGALINSEDCYNYICG